MLKENIIADLLPFGNIPIDYSILSNVLSGYRSPKDKISSLEKNNTLIRLKKGLYVVSSETSQKMISTQLIANHLYGPSYVSLQSALSFHGLIPERVHTITSVTTKRAKQFSTPLGIFDYQTIPSEYYPIGIQQQTTESGLTFLLATPEKAICDLILCTSGIRLQSVGAMQIYLEEDMRLDLSQFERYNTDIIRECIDKGKKKTTLTFLLKILEQ